MCIIPPSFCLVRYCSILHSPFPLFSLFNHVVTVGVDFCCYICVYSGVDGSSRAYITLGSRVSSCFVSGLRKGCHHMFVYSACLESHCLRSEVTLVLWYDLCVNCNCGLM